MQHPAAAAVQMPCSHLQDTVKSPPDLLCSGSLSTLFETRPQLRQRDRLEPNTRARQTHYVQQKKRPRCWPPATQRSCEGHRDRDALNPASCRRRRERCPCYWCRSTWWSSWKHWRPGSGCWGKCGHHRRGEGRRRSKNRNDCTGCFV